ncbi:MAG: Glu-tRNA(Gln) amidotransferase subunit GatD [Candidatus Micrarchaeota archaeon]|nr:Glu-tRNA(Gln) amidotransferase subunit GatD [Candidatus Micrarchaeota archaeon]MDE1847369.1 Glu-tRNA(Gln) amidotransferase subunit GatD [Candidatus Micrarchaeota archaeon]MDE1863984.1 Glu-tRNA(Gln) amidotransferase subunit GatD [Candidatus Micrarchaeota archaeon]
MYSKEIEAIFKSKNIAIGDSISLALGDGNFTGTIMPRPDIGDAAILVLKQSNGYNIGLRIGKGAKIEKLSIPNKAHASQRHAPIFGRVLPKISMIYTGGTIGSKVDYVTGGVYSLTRPEELITDVPELAEIAEFKISNPFSILSEDMTYKEWQMIAKHAAEELNSGSRGIVITHGTDTMHFTASSLSFMLSGLNAPVVLTGAQRSSDRGSSDAFTNLICSFHAAAKSNIAEVGICMHSTSSDTYCDFIRGTKARKMHTSRRDAFRPVNNLPIARITPSGGTEYLSSHREISKENKRKVVANTKFENRIALIKAYPNSDPAVIDYYTGKGCKGIIIEGTGLGHVPTSPSDLALSWISHVKRANDSGIVVGVTSQTLYGRVSENVYRNLRILNEAGAVHCEDMLPETAYVKLGWLLANSKKEEVKALLKTDITGEITQRTETDWFM